MTQFNLVPNHMTPNNKRPTLKQQMFIIRVIDRIGCEPFGKPVHLYSLDDLKTMEELYNSVAFSQRW